MYHKKSMAMDVKVLETLRLLCNGMVERIGIVDGESASSIMTMIVFIAKIETL